MKIICITGYSGAGKTTVAGILLKKLPNSALVEGDEYWRKSPLVFKNEFERIFNMPLDEKNCLQCLLSALDTGAVQGSEYMCTIIPYVDSGIRESIEVQKKLNKDFVIVDYATLEYSKTWADADYRIVVDSPKQQRAEKFRERTFERYGYYNDKRFDIREATIKIGLQEAKNVDFVIMNHYNMAQLEADVQKVCDRIRSA